MGASCWIYYVPYQENLEQALQDLRQQIFETNQYGGIYPGEWVVDISGEEIDISQMQEVREQEDGLMLPVSPSKAFQTIEEKIEEVLKRCEGGTHSILDIRRLIATSHYYGDVPLSEEMIQHLFAGARPTKAVVEAIVFEESLWSRLDEWFQAESMHIARGYKGHRIYGFSEEILRFFAVEHPKEEIVETLLTREGFWTGIHSCLCSVIEKMAMWTRYGTAMPFSSADLIQLFASETPTRAEVEAAVVRREIWNHIGVGVSYYAIIYQENVPHEIVFVGASGD